MRVVIVKRIKDFADNHPTSKIPLLHWYEIVKNAKWKNITDIRNDFNSVDYIGNNRNIFNIKGNDFRLICIIIFIPRNYMCHFWEHIANTIK